MLRILSVSVALILVGAVAVGAGAVYVLYSFGRGLPEYKQLAVYEPPVMTRVHAADGQLIAEYARQRRLYVPIAAVPQVIIDAFLSAEDKNFYDHMGIDINGVLRAIITNVQAIGSDKRPVGGSTITQQVAKNFLLNNEVSYERKIKEAILALRIERAFTKDRILELYLNDVYLGRGAYGVASAALNYFDKSLEEVTLPEAAYLAVLLKAPNNYHPIYKTEAAIIRRNWIIGRMLEDGKITQEEAETAIATPLEVDLGRETHFVQAEYFAEEIRRELYGIYGEDMLYEGGLSVRSTLVPRLQRAAQTALRNGILAYDRRHGWRGPLGHTEPGDASSEILQNFQAEGLYPSWQLALVVEAVDRYSIVELKDGTPGVIPLQQMSWAREWREGQRVGGQVRRADDVLDAGDIVAVEATGVNLQGTMVYELRQIPDVNGAIIAMDPHTGRILAMEGGISYATSEFNRATQAARQPGSAFKPFVYSAALLEGFTPSTLVLDAPFVIDQGPGLGIWKPANYSQEFYGPSTLRLGLEKSRNLMTVRLAQYIGMDRVVDMAGRFGVVENMRPTLAMALGAGETTLLQLTAGYSMLVNGGHEIEPTLIDRIQDRRGRTVFRHDRRQCIGCSANAWYGQAEPFLADERARVIDSATAYQIVAMLEGVIQRGTGVGARIPGRPLAGKTGTSNDALDTWFIGFSPDFAVGVYAGFDNPRTLGDREQGASIAAPIFREFIAEALEKEPAIPFRIPSDIRLVRVNAKTGLPAAPNDRNAILEAFKPGTEPIAERWVLDGTGGVLQTSTSPRVGTGGLY